MSNLPLAISPFRAAVEHDDEPPVTGKELADVTRDVCAPLERKATPLWWFAFLASAAVMTLGLVAIGYQVSTGIGTWGLNKTVGWAFDITNFVFWVGIGHAGTLISAVLFLLRQKWRTSVNRSAEAMTLFAVLCAAIFPLIHMGRPWLAFWVFPYPNTRGSLWVNFRSPLLWDVFAISVYFTVSAVFWFIGLMPDLATIRDRSTGLRQKIFGVLSFGWNGSLRTWTRYEKMYLLLAGLATPLVLSVHSIVSFDFATSVLPGWHATIFPPYFVAGAIFSGMSMVLTLMIIARAVMPALRDYLTVNHIDAMAKLVLATSGMVGLAYLTELFTAFYSGNPYERYAFVNRAMGPFAWGYWTMVICNVALPQLYWFRRVRRSIVAVFILSIFVNIGMWFERFIIIVTSLHRDFLPSSWASYTPTIIEIATLAGTFGLFFTAFLLFCRFLPMIAMAEVKGVLHRPEDERIKRVVRELTRGGYVVADVHTPYAVHGLEKVAGVKPSRLGWACAIGGFTGAGLILLFQSWTSAIDWGIDVGGKPLNSIPAFIPVTFEVGVLLGAFATVLAFLFRSRLWPGKRAQAGATDDQFVVVLRAENAAFDPEHAEQIAARYGVRVECGDASRRCPAKAATRVAALHTEGDR
ncbi:MAG TPA: quinol:electron acceptor oxidoreductase subunit ActD [Thermoanaerobaculia bacterium]|nr:quinol:electron acceptor oxidoreductase subunit ActD [Thermoanaerobaculia bacterium]